MKRRLARLTSLAYLLRRDYYPILEALAAIKTDQLNTRTTAVDVRLCIDFDNDDEKPSWFIETGDHSYTPRHFEHCGTAVLTGAVAVDALLDDMIEQILDQCASHSIN